MLCEHALYHQIFIWVLLIKVIVRIGRVDDVALLGRLLGTARGKQS